MTDKRIRLSVVLGELSSIPSELADALGWDNRKGLLDVFYEGRNADHLADEDDFHKDYGGLIAVARYAMNETLEAAKANVEHAASWEPH
jgi:hypothetical protein